MDSLDPLSTPRASLPPQKLAGALVAACAATLATTPAAPAQPGREERPREAGTRAGRPASRLLPLLAAALGALWLLVLALGFVLAWLVWLLVDTRVIGPAAGAGGSAWEGRSWAGAEAFFQG